MAITDPSNPSIPVWRIFLLFFKIGCVAFGGFTALISVVEKTVIHRFGMLSKASMLDGISLAMLLPGPVAVNVVAFAGYRLAGGPGAFAAVTGVILPAFLLILGLSRVYFTYGDLPLVSRAFAGFMPAVTAIIITTAWAMAKKAVPDRCRAVLCVASALILVVLGGFYTTLGLILAAGAAGRVIYGSAGEQSGRPIGKTAGPQSSGPLRFKFSASVFLLGLFLVLFLVPLPGLDRDSLARIFATFSGMSLVLFGGGYVFIPMIQEMVVDGLGWVTASEFSAAIALGQVTPGPILISAAFIGFKIKGMIGAALATFAIFFPSALLMVNASLVLDRLRQSPGVAAALMGIRAAVTGMIFASALVIARGCQVHWATPVIFLGALIALVRYKTDVVWIIPPAGLAGMLFY